MDVPGCRRDCLRVPMCTCIHTPDAAWPAWSLSLVLILVWPLATLPFGVFPKAIWNLWVAVAFMWGWAAALMIIGLPIYENRKTFAAVLTCNTSGGTAAVAAKATTAA